MTIFSFWQRWLFIVSLVIIAFGILIAFSSGTPIFDLFNQYINPVFWDSAAIGDSIRGFQLFVYGVVGAATAGWGVSIAFIAYYPFRNKEKWAWNCLVTGILLWFSIDTSISVYYKVYFNTICNLSFLILTMLPIIFTKKYFTNK